MEKASSKLRGSFSPSASSVYGFKKSAPISLRATQWSLGQEICGAQEFTHFHGVALLGYLTMSKLDAESTERAPAYSHF